MDDDEIRDHVPVFMLARHETMAGALTFALHLLVGPPSSAEAVTRSTRS